MDMELKNKIACITGGSVGIGLGIAKELAKEGTHLALCARNEERLKESANQIRNEYGVKVLSVKADVSNMKDIQYFVKEIEKYFGGVDILINNAGTGTNEKIMTAPDEKWYSYWDLHVMAAIRTSRLLVPFMKKRGGGAIINIASVCAKQPMDFEPIYNTTKAALVMFTKCLANELVHDNIHVNSVCPGLIITPDWRKTATIFSKEMGITPDEYLAKVAKDLAPISRFATTEELAKFIVFLCSPLAAYCIGSSYYFDGGLVKSIL
jgi:3-oxoacyl-[acyl-carrier protein] reductase